MRCRSPARRGWDTGLDANAAAAQALPERRNLGSAPGWLCHLVMLVMYCRSRAAAGGARARTAWPEPSAPSVPRSPHGRSGHSLTGRKGKGAGGRISPPAPAATETASGLPSHRQCPRECTGQPRSTSKARLHQHHQGRIVSYFRTRVLSQQLFMTRFILLTHWRVCLLHKR